jgi:hypothetical protein
MMITILMQYFHGYKCTSESVCRLQKILHMENSCHILTRLRRLNCIASLINLIDWLSDSSKIQRLNFSPKTKIDEGRMHGNDYFPISLVKVENEVF